MYICSMSLAGYATGSVEEEGVHFFILKVYTPHSFPIRIIVVYSFSPSCMYVHVHVEGRMMFRE